MQRRSFITASTLGVARFARAGGRTRPVKIIFDTDLESDVDDVGATAVLHALADRGEAEILAMGISATNEGCAPCLDALNTYFRRPGIPIGVVKQGGAPRRESKYAQKIAAEFPRRLQFSADAPEAVAVYREALMKSPDRSVVMVSVGYLTNFARLLQPTDGVELVRRKVRAWVCMGGAFPKGREWNIHSDAAASVDAIANWPTPIVFSGFEIGKEIFTGARLVEALASSPVRRAYELYNGLKNRESWDQTAVLYAVRGLNGGRSELWDLSLPGTMRVAADGSNDWIPGMGKQHVYLLRKQAPVEVAAAIEALMLTPPRT